MEQAIRCHKRIIYYKLNSAYCLHSKLSGIDQFTKKKCALGDPVNSMEEVANIVSRYDNGEYDIFNSEFSQLNTTELLEQYRLFLDTSERLVERRQAVNNFYLSANTAIFSVVALIISLMDKNENKFLGVILLAFVLLCLVGIVLGISWISILDSYGTLNSSKMKIISIIEKRLPISLFDSEWQVMSDKLNSRRYVSFTDSEKRLPKLFIALYILLILVCFALFFILIGV